MDWRERDGVRWLEAELGGARAAFSTRVGGVSTAPFDSLNLGVLTDDERDAVRREPRAARGRARPRAGADPDRAPGPRRRARVPRRRRSSRARSREPGSAIPEVDGHVVARPGLAPLVFTADCLPVALAGPGGVAMLHCGWRGLAAGIVAAGVEAVGATAAAIGPGIGPCCYEVGDEVLDAFAGAGEGSRRRAGMLDLAEVARRLLRAAGVERVEAAGLCTSCEPELFFSHRRDAGRTGRQGGLAWIEAG